MSTLIQKVNSGPLAEVPMHAAQPNLMLDTSMPVSAVVATFFVALGAASVEVTVALAAGY